MSDPQRPFVSRGGLKLDAALDAFGLDVAGKICADFGANVGGFTDCLLRRGAMRVYAVDTGYGDLAWRLRQDGRVRVMERTNALHAERPEPVSLVTVDMAWTPQRRAIPAAATWLAPGGTVVSLLKPHYELAKLRPKRRARKPLDTAEADAVCREVCGQLVDLGHAVRAIARCAIRGKGGNREYVLWIEPQRSR